MLSKERSKYYSSKGVIYITYREAIQFIVDVRGNSWIEAGIGVTSVHQQWDEMLVEMFRIANAHDRDAGQRVSDLGSYLAT